MTEEVQQLDNTSNTSAIAPLLSLKKQVMDVVKTKADYKKEKCKPMTKVVIRRLPPTMTESQFIDQVSPLPEHDYFHFVKADMSLGQNAYSRAYINFIEQNDIFVFREKFDNYVFVDSKGTEFAAVVEFAPFQKLPKKRIGKRKDPKCGTIESDPYFINFLESLKNEDTESATALPKTEYSYQPFENAQKRVTSTPLLEYLKQRKAEKQRMRDEKREERRRRDIERRRTKDEPTISKVLKNPDADREISRENKENKEEKEKPFIKESKNRKRDDVKAKDKVLVTRDRDSKGTTKNYRDREDKKHERENKHGKKHEEKKLHNKREEKESYSRTNKEDQRDAKENGGNHHKERTFEEKRGKSYEKMRQEKKRLAEAKKHGNVVDENVDIQMEKIKKNHVETKNNNVENSEDVIAGQKIKSITHEDDLKPNKCDLQYNNIDCTTENDAEINLIINKMSQLVKESIDFSGGGDNNAMKKSSKIVKRRSSLESGGEGGGGDTTRLRRHKSLDGGDQDNLQKNETDDKEKDKKDPRLERRIRNKDRPAMEIYRPGMGRFSKQRLEREKSTHDDRASLSQSPTPSIKQIITKNIDNSSISTSNEMRSMTFKRSASRDTP
ncbi:hypothetical protein PV325_002248 [Microctonus aethiopoides]|nr:hypothetical protein PV325_002248 [Microctonus aethiopoides]KAK0094206.1 hypothetical protein PV326_011553 [Microctonus aethiopoides]